MRATFTAVANGNSTFVTTINSSNDGSIISRTASASTVGEVQDTKALTFIQDEQQWVEFELDISKLGVEEDGRFPDSLWINLENTVGAVDVIGMQFELIMLKFRDGGHI